MRITGRQLRQIIKEEITRAHGRASLNEEQTTTSAPPSEKRRAAQIIGDILNNSDAFVIDDIGAVAFNPKYVLELKDVLEDSPILMSLFKGYFGLESLRYGIARSETQLVDTLNQMLQDLRIGPLEQIIPDKDKQIAFMRAFYGMFGRDLPVDKTAAGGYSEMMREHRRRHLHR